MNRFAEVLWHITKYSTSKCCIVLWYTTTFPCLLQDKMSGGCGGGHSHDHCGGGGHEHTPPELGVAYSLYTRIDIHNVECLNESVEGAGKTVFKAWEDRLNRDEVMTLEDIL